MLESHGNTFFLKINQLLFKFILVFCSPLQKVTGAFLGFSLTQAHIPSFSLLGPGLLSAGGSCPLGQLLFDLSPLWFGSPVPLPEESAPVLSVSFFFLSPRVSWGCFCEQMTIPGLKLLLLHPLALSFPLEGRLSGSGGVAGCPVLWRSLGETWVFVCRVAAPFPVCAPSSASATPCELGESGGEWLASDILKICMCHGLFTY